MKYQKDKDLEFLKNVKSQDLENSKPKLMLEYEASLKGNTMKLLKELTKEIYKAEMSCPRELKAYLNYGDFLEVIQMVKQQSKNIEKEYNLLKVELGKNGIDEEWFLEIINRIK